MIKNKVLCFCNSNRVWGGGERWHFDTALHFAKLGYKTILCVQQNSELQQKVEAILMANPALQENLSLAAWEFRSSSFLNPFLIHKFSKFLRAHQVSHFIAGLPLDFKIAALAINKNKQIKLIYRRGSAIPVRASLSNRYFYAKLDALITNSQETANGVLQQTSLIAKAKVHIVYNGLQSEAFDQSLKEAEALPLNKKFNTLIIGNAGRLNVQKGHKYLLYMSAYLKEQGLRHKVLIAGEGELRTELEQLAASLGLSTQGEERDIVFLGFVNEMARFWNSIDVFVLSSLWEGFGYVLAEAMLAQKPLLAFNCNSMPELIKDGFNGALVDPPQEREAPEVVAKRLAESLLTMLANKENFAELGRNGRNFCIENFDQTKALEQVENILFGK